jgi:ABC-type Fe3+ transport system substrate-binding protein
MKSITESDCILTIAESYPQLRKPFEDCGLGSYFSPESLERIGRFARLGTLLKSAGVDPVAFMGGLNQLLAEQQPVRTVERADSLHFMTMLPCGLRNPFVTSFQTYMEQNPGLFVGFNYLNEGNYNHELSYYPLVDQIESIDELPDVMIASDVNHFFHRPFVEKFIETGEFECVIPREPNDYLKDCGFFDPAENYTMYTANMLVMAVDKARLGDRPMPRVWDDLLDPAFENDIVMRGNDDFFCNAILLPYYKAHGIDAIRKFARNIKAGRHPADMVKLAGSGKEDAAAVYVMPYFFAKKIKSPDVSIVWPEDGAIASPVFILVKKGMREKHASLFAYLFSKSVSRMLSKGHFPPFLPDIPVELPRRASWLGWDFLSTQDVGAIKEEIGAVVAEVRSV